MRNVNCYMGYCDMIIYMDRHYYLCYIVIIVLIHDA